ncbi:hypothetical protein PMAYCL1PPCAC_06627 [Pristionchus mayeri]|uniref:Uncharacterized protein n=1 Tax=Pristionchus mayeri TaxID=1317129 RepID=A0AAN4ZET0_9BILA|nr:hypothetical protein PMAYCL1PPCAC_06627 [Pristionchus mayeri]
MDEVTQKKHQKEVTQLVERTISDSHYFPPGHGFQGYKPFTSIVNEMRYREMGDRRMRPEKIWPSLVKNERRVFQLSSEMKTKGETMIDCKRAVSHTEVIDLEEEVVREFVHDRERIDCHSVRAILVADEDTLVRSNAHLDGSTHAKRIMEKYVILLTDLGQVRMYVEEEGNYVLAHRFNLPAHLFKFKSLYWNIEKDEIFCVGVTPRRHIDDMGDDQFSHTTRRSNYTPFSQSFALAVIRLDPVVVVKYLVRLDSQLFGQLNDVAVHNDALVCMSHKCTTIYNMNELCAEYIESVPTPTDYGSPTSDRVVLFNMIIKKKPFPLRTFPGSIFGIDINYASMHVILQYNRGRSTCQLEGMDESVPQFIDEWKEIRNSKLVIHNIFGGARFHPDVSTKIIRLEGDILKCFSLQSVLKERGDKKEDSGCVVSLLWSVQLLPPTKTRAGSPDGDSDQNSVTNIVHSIKLVPGNMLMIIMIYDAALMYSMNAPYRFCPMAVFLDSITGRLIRVIPVPNTVFFHGDSVVMTLGSLLSMGVAEDSDTRRVRVHRLVEMDTPASEIPKFKSDVLNRKQRRLKRKAESLLSREEMHLFPGSHKIV